MSEMLLNKAVAQQDVSPAVDTAPQRPMTTRIAIPYRCYGHRDAEGHWGSWRFAPATGPRFQRALAAAAAQGHVFFLSVQTFAPPANGAGDFRWKTMADQYRGDNALPHWAPLYFDVDAEGDLEKALALARALVAFFTGALALPPEAVRVWFSGSKGFHILVSPTALGIKPSPSLTSDMKAVALGLCRSLRDHGAPDLETDAAVYSLPRMLRAADQINPKSGLFKVELWHEELHHRSADEIVALARARRGNLWPGSLWEAPLVAPAAAWWTGQLAQAQKPRQFRRRTAELTGERLRPDGFVVDELLSPDMPDCIRRIVAANVAPGRRNRCELQIACWAKGAGRSLADAIALLARWGSVNRPELTASGASRKAESIARTVYSGSHYGFSCAASRLVARDISLGIDCGQCRAVHRRALKQLASLREGEDAQWAPLTRIGLEEARERITGALERCFDGLGASGDSRKAAAGNRQDARRPASPRKKKAAGRLCGADA
jgi:hypothetical protein